MKISVVEPVSPAIERTTEILFRPFDLGKWFTLGFCAFLATLGEGGGGSGNFNTGGGGRGGGGGGNEFEALKEWIQENLTLIISIVAGAVVVGCLLGLLLTWLSSRGKFMFIDGIVHNRGAVAAPWREYRREGNSLFVFQIVFQLTCFLIFVLLLAACVLIAYPSIEAEEFGTSAVVALAVGIPVVLLYALAVGFIGMCLRHFVVPIMYLRRIGVMEAWGIFRHEMLAGRVGTFVLYVLFQIVIGIAIGFIALAATCMTCCLAALPYLGTVILLPLFVFDYSYHLYFLEQFGPEWTFFWDEFAPGAESTDLLNEPPALSDPYAPEERG
jgi:hypothetical protein